MYLDMYHSTMSKIHALSLCNTFSMCLEKNYVLFDVYQGMAVKYMSMSYVLCTYIEYLIWKSTCC